MKNTIDILSEADLDRLSAGLFKVLAEAGVKVHSPEILDRLRSGPLRVDPGTRIVRIPEKEARRVLDEHLKSPGGIEREGAPEGEYEPALWGVIAPFYYDYAARARRESTLEILIEMLKFGDTATGHRHVGAPVVPRDVPPRIEPLESLYQILKHCAHPGGAYVENPDQLKYLREIGEIWCGDQWRFFGSYPNFMTSPLTLGFNFAGFILEQIRLGCKKSFDIGVQPIAGASTPVTVAGNIVTGAAEIVGCWTVIKALAPDAEVNGAICAGTLDMRTAVARFNSPEAMLQNLGTCELFRRRFGGHVSVAAGPDYIDAKLPGIQAAHDRAWRAMAISSFAGEFFRLGGTGTLDAGRMFSPEQFILERELGAGLWKFGKGMEVSPETLALNEIVDAGPGEGNTFLGLDHTLRNFRDSNWRPEFLDWSSWRDDSTENAREKDLLAAAHARVRECIARHEMPGVDARRLAKVRNVIDRAGREPV